MMLLELGANNVIVTLNDSITLVTPEYVFIFVNDSTDKKVACKVGADLSAYPDRYNKFLITVKTNPVALNSEINISLGFHHYYVYEYVDADTFNFAGVDTLDLETLSEPVEQGKMKYITDPVELEYYRNIRQSIKSYT